MEITFEAVKKAQVENVKTGQLGQYYHGKVAVDSNSDKVGGFVGVSHIEFVVKDDGAIEQLKTGQIQMGTPWKISDPNWKWADGTPTDKT